MTSVEMISYFFSKYQWLIYSSIYMSPCLNSERNNSETQNSEGTKIRKAKIWKRQNSAGGGEGEGFAAPSAPADRIFDFRNCHNTFLCYHRTINMLPNQFIIVGVSNPGATGSHVAPWMIPSGPEPNMTPILFQILKTNFDYLSS